VFPGPSLEDEKKLIFMAKKKFWRKKTFIRSSFAKFAKKVKSWLLFQIKPAGLNNKPFH
jgi:hypothetical protein